MMNYMNVSAVSIDPFIFSIPTALSFCPNCAIHLNNNNVINSAQNNHRHFVGLIKNQVLWTFHCKWYLHMQIFAKSIRNCTHSITKIPKSPVYYIIMLAVFIHMIDPFMNMLNLCLLNNNNKKTSYRKWH